jgi:hypothetical protein
MSSGMALKGEACRPPTRPDERPELADFVEKFCRPKTAEIFCRSETGPRSNHSK